MLRRQGIEPILTIQIIRPLTSSGLFSHNSLDQSISVSVYYGFIEIPVVNANSVIPDQMLRSAGRRMDYFEF